MAPAHRSARARGPASASARAIAGAKSEPAARLQQASGAFGRVVATSPEPGRRAAGYRPSWCYGSFESTWPPFRGLSPAPSHHLGADVFVGTFDSRDLVATSRSVGDRTLRRAAGTRPAQADE